MRIGGGVFGHFQRDDEAVVLFYLRWIYPIAVHRIIAALDRIALPGRGFRQDWVSGGCQRQGDGLRALINDLDGCAESLAASQVR